MFDVRVLLDRLVAGDTEPLDPGRAGLADPIQSPADLPPDWRIEWEERAAVREYDGGQAREHAEAEALGEIIVRMRAAGYQFQEAQK